MATWRQLEHNQRLLYPVDGFIAHHRLFPSRDSLKVGDLVNRGPDSIHVLRWAFKHQDSISLVLGNHDLHLLAVAEGFGKLSSGDTLRDILNAADGKILLGLAADATVDVGW